MKRRSIRRSGISRRMPGLRADFRTERGGRKALVVTDQVVGRTAMNRRDGKIALISGAARGIGAETARLMVEAGARVVVGDVLDERGRETARNIGGVDSAAFHHLDVTSEEDWRSAIGAAVTQWGGLDI